MLKVLENLPIKNSYEFKVSDIEGGFKVEITKEEAPQLESVPVVKDDSYIVVINKDQMGHGSEELGKRLIKAYLYALGEQEVLPKKIIFYNNGGVLVDKTRSHVIEELKNTRRRWCRNSLLWSMY